MQTSTLKRANDCFISVAQRPSFVPLFDQFWRSGELALLFGAAGTGKSVLAVQIADAIARGGRIDGLLMNAGRQKVLYVDVNMSDGHFNARYSAIVDGCRIDNHRFPANFYRDRPASNRDLLEWLRENIVENRVRVVVIDDLSAFRETVDGTRETLKLMRELKQLKEELDISILVLTGSRSPRGGAVVDEADLRRSAVLCDVADSVFALGRHPQTQYHSYLIQLRSRNAPIVWNAQNAPICRLGRSVGTFLGFSFDERFAPQYDLETRLLSARVKRLYDGGNSYRAVATTLEISKNRAARLNKLWKPEFEEELSEIEPGSDPAESEDDFDDESFDEDYEPFAESDEPDDDDPKSQANEAFSTAPPAAESDVGRSDEDFDPMSHLERSYDRNAREIFVEQADENGDPIVWYRYHSKNLLSRFSRKGMSVMGEHVDGPVCLFNSS